MKKQSWGMYSIQCQDFLDHLTNQDSVFRPENLSNKKGVKKLTPHIPQIPLILSKGYKIIQWRRPKYIYHVESDK